MDGEHPNDPLHGVTLEAMLLALVEKHGWEGLAERIPVRCFESEPSLKSSLTFLRRTPWARAKVEALYLGKLRPRRPARRRPGTEREGPASAPRGGGRKDKPQAGPAAKHAEPRASRPADEPARGASQSPDAGSAAPEGRPAASGGDPKAKPAARGRNRYPGLFED